MSIILLSLLLSASQVPAGPDPGALPTEMDVAEAYTDYTAEHCRRLIDQCVPMHATSAAAISNLTCRARRGGSADCRFVVGMDRCTARLTRDAASTRWTARDYRVTPWRLRLRCRPMSICSSFNARTACALGGCPSIAPTPAENIRNSPLPRVA